MQHLQRMRHSVVERCSRANAHKPEHEGHPLFENKSGIVVDAAAQVAARAS
jgi:uncharacterized membrane protein